MCCLAEGSRGAAAQGFSFQVIRLCKNGMGHAALQEANLKQKQKSKRKSFCFLLLELMQPVPLVVEVSIGAAVLHGVKLLALGSFKHSA